jgi:hypothetical protein
VPLTIDLGVVVLASVVTEAGKELLDLSGNVLSTHNAVGK